MGAGGGAVRLCQAHWGIKKMLNTSKIYKMRIVFHLAPDAPGQGDKVGLLRAWVAQSGLEFAPAKQNPRVPRIAYGPALKKGQQARREYVDIYLCRAATVCEARALLALCKPEGLSLLEVQRVPYALAGVQQLAGVAVYEVEGDFSAWAPTQPFENYVSSTRLERICHAANGMVFTTDLKPFVVSAQTLRPQRVQLTLQRVGEQWIDPLEVIYAWLGIELPVPQKPTDERFIVTRQGLYWQDSQQNLHLI